MVPECYMWSAAGFVQLPYCLIKYDVAVHTLNSHRIS
jgi:hypothetical protein